MTDAWDRIDAEELRRRGSLKWTATDADIAAWVAESDFGTATPIVAAATRAMAAGLTGYLPPAVERDLAAACATWHEAQYGWPVDPRRIHPVGDVLEAFRITVEYFSAPGSAVVLPTPAYMPFVTIPRSWGRDVVEVPMPSVDGRSHLDLEAIDEALASGGGLLVLVNPHNPTGRVLEPSELAAMAEVVEARHARVFADEIHAPLVHQGRQHVPYASVSAAAAGHTVTATSASKAWNIPGLKCAQVLLGNDDDEAVWRSARPSEGASTVGAVANTAAYRDGRPWLTDLLTYVDRNRHALAETLPDDVGYRPPEGTYLAWLDLRAALDAHPDAPEWRVTPPGELGRWIQGRAGLAVTDGARCGEAGRGFVRVNLAMPRPLVHEAGRRLAACLGG